MEAFEIIGTVESKTSQKGGAYLVIKTEKGNTYTLWGEHEDADRLQPGVEVRLDYEQKGNFKNISAFEVLGKVRTAKTNGNDIHIVREVCLKAAVELAKANIESGVEMKSDAVLRVARVFEDWVIRE